MAKTKRIKDMDQGYNLADRATKNMTYMDLKRACVARGMPFDDVLNSSVMGLHSWFGNNFYRGQNLALLDEFDNYVDQQLTAAGYTDPNDPLKHPSLRLGFIGKKDENGNVVNKKKPRLKALDKPKKKKRERVEGTKVIAGTKKALTYKGAMKGIVLDKIIAKFKEKFGDDVNEKSIAIWYKRALNEIKNGSKGS